jgi:hypothetical protein
MADRMTDALDETVERLTKVMLRYAEDSRGPSIPWVHGLAEIVHSLALTRVALAGVRDDGR